MGNDIRAGMADFLESELAKGIFSKFGEIPPGVAIEIKTTFREFVPRSGEGVHEVHEVHELVDHIYDYYQTVVVDRGMINHGDQWHSVSFYFRKVDDDVNHRVIINESEYLYAGARRRPPGR